MHLKVSSHLTSMGYTLHNIIQQLLRHFIPFLCECTDEDVLACRVIVSTSNLPPKSIPHILNRVQIWRTWWPYEALNILAVLDNTEQQVLDDILRCRVHKNEVITDSTTEKTNMRKQNFINVMLARHSPIHNHMQARAVIDHDGGPHHDIACRISIPFLDIFWTISSTTLVPDQLASTIR